MTNKIFPCLWFDSQAKAAAEFYCSIFQHSKITIDSPVVVQFEIEGKKIMCLNGGPIYKINPSISLFVQCQTHEEIDRLWGKMIDGGQAMMPLEKYPWSEKYGWVVDKFGMTWQFMLGDSQEGGNKIIPSMLFVGSQYGNAKKAIEHYTSIFPNSEILFLDIHQSGDPQQDGNLNFGEFSLAGTNFAAMDGFGNHDFRFNEAVSFFVDCATQEEIDHYWDKLTEGGLESQCGWLSDKFGVSWQIVPTVLGQLLSDLEKGPPVMQAMLKMKKLDIETLMNA